MADLKLTILADLRKLKADIDKVLKETFDLKINSEVSGSSSGGKETTGLLGGILSKLAPLALIAGLLLNLKPIQQILETLTAFVTFALLKILKFFGIFEGFKEIPQSRPEALAEGVKEAAKSAQEQIAATIQQNDLISNLADLLKLNNIELGEAGLSSQKIREVLEQNGINSQAISEEFLSALASLKDGSEASLQKVRDTIKLPTDQVKKLNADLSSQVKSLAQEQNISLSDIETAVSDGAKDSNEKLEESIKKLGFLEKISDLIQKILTVVNSFLRNVVGTAAAKFLGFGGRDEQDFLVRPGSAPVSFSPNDTIIGVKDPGALGGSNKTFNFYGVTPDEMIQVIKRELEVDINRSGRY